jgi:acyl-coenzyme A thioesterase PaaI-like protein
VTGEVPVDDGNCFACGPNNPDGLHLAFERHPDGSVRATIVLDGKYQGWRGIAHGGIVMMLLDEAMAHASGNAGERGMTASMSVRFRKPVPLGVPIVLDGFVRWRRGRVLGLEGRLSDPDGVLLATSEGNFVSAGAM